MSQRHHSVKDLKSISGVKQRASQYPGSNETNKQVKQAILQELNSHLISIRPQIIHKKADEANKRLKKDAKKPNIKRSENVISDKGHLQDEQRFPSQHQATQVVSRIPRLISDAASTKFSKKQEVSFGLKPARIPGYDWDKKGRISELKIRYLARKYLGFWLKNVFGRVSPSIARGHYKKKLMKDAFHVLENLWWNSRKGWKLNIRAEYHNRYRIWKSTLKTWKLFVVHSKQKAIKWNIAEKFDEMNSMKRAFSMLHLHCEAKRQKKERVKKAERQREYFSCRLTFKTWVLMTSASQINRSREAEALGFWAFSLKSKMFRRWVVSKKAQDVENAKLKMADVHYGRKITRKCLTALLSHVENRRGKQRIREFAVKHFHQNLKYRSIRIWYSQLEHRLEIKNLEERITFIARKFNLRFYFTQWQKYTEDFRIFQEKMVVAENHNNHQLKLKYLKVLRIATERRRVNIERNEVAIAFRTKKALSRHWNRWLLRCENSEELKLYPLTKIARSFFRGKRLKESLVQWWYYVRWRRGRKLTYQIADEHFKKVSLPKYFWKLNVYAEIRKTKNERRNVADDFNRELRCARAFYTWLKNSRLKQDLRMLERMAILQHEETCKRKTMLKWRRMTYHILEAKSNEETADAHLELALKRRYFSLLKKNLMHEKTRRIQEAFAVRHYNKKVFYLVFVSWRKFTQTQVLKHKKTESARLHYDQVVLKKIMKSFKTHVQERREINEEVERRENIHSGILLRWTFHRWYENVGEVIEEKRNFRISEDFKNFRIEKKLFSSWKEYAVLKSHKRQINNERLALVTQHLNTGKLRRAFNSMREYAVISKRENHLKTIAIQFNERRLKIKVMMGWKCFMALSFKKVLLQRQSAIHFTNKRTKSVLQCWKIQKSLEERNRVNVVMWWWSQNLQRKALYAWIDYVHVSKQNKIRIAKALELRRDWMLENCVKKWFEYSSDMIAFRSKIAQARQIEGTVKLQDKVRKYALTWYNKTKRSKTQNASHSATHIGGLKQPSFIQDPVASIGMPDMITRSTDILEIPTIKETCRLAPRKPDYLKESFDLNLLLEAADDRVHHCNSKASDESQPRFRAPQPETQTRLQKHPLNRSRREDSIDFPASSEDDTKTEKKIVAQRQFHDKRSTKGVVLMPPSLFEKVSLTVSKDRRVQPKLTNNPTKTSESLILKKGAPVQSASHETKKNQKGKIVSLKPSQSSDQEVIDSSDDEEVLAASPSELSSEDDEDYVDSGDDEKSALLSKVSIIKDSLLEYQEQQKRYQDLSARHLHLSTWLEREEGRCNEDQLRVNSEYQQAMELCTEIKDEKDGLKVEIERKKPIVTKMARNVKELTCKINQM